MKVSFRIILTSILLFTIVFNSFSQDPEEDEEIEVVDAIEDYEITESEYYELLLDPVMPDERLYDAEDLSRYKSNPEYNYDNDPKYDTDLWGYLKGLFFKFIEKVFGKKGAATFWDMVQYSLILFGVVFLLYSLAKMNTSNVFQKESKNKVFDLETVDEEASSEQLDNLLKLALEQSNYRVAVRIKFLKILKLLDKNEIIIWKDFKTNTDYAHEIESDTIRTSFNKIRWDYENIWYGEFAIDQSYYKEHSAEITRLENQLNPT